MQLVSSRSSILTQAIWLQNYSLSYYALWMDRWMDDEWLDDAYGQWMMDGQIMDRWMDDGQTDEWIDG